MIRSRTIRTRTGLEMESRVRDISASVFKFR
jgi:hypothetical protein